MKPLVTSGSSDSTMEGRGAQGLLSPANERTTGLLLKLALEMEVTVTAFSFNWDSNITLYCCY